MLVSQDKTSKPAYAISTDPYEYKQIPWLTAGDSVPLLEGTFGSFSASPTQTFVVTGPPDGLGLLQQNGLKYLFVNNELSDTTTTGLQTSQGEGQINGARVSLFVFDDNGDVIGGKNLIETVLIDGVSYSLNPTTGNYQDAAGNVLRMTDHNNFTRFCSGYLATYGFVNEVGQEVPIWFAPEERDGGLGVPVTPDGVATPIRGLGTFSKENVLADPRYRATNSDYTVLLSTEDKNDGELYLYVGGQSPANPNGFTSVLGEFALYVLKVVDPTTGEVFTYETMPENQVLQAQWTLVPPDIALRSDPTQLSNFVNIAGNSTNLRRLEDIAANPNQPGEFYFVTTGTTDEITVGGVTFQDNPFGKLNRFSFVLDANGVPQTGTFETVLVGGAGKGVSYDNITVDGNGNVFIQEDETAGTEAIMTAENRDAGIWRYNTAENAGVIGTDNVDFIVEINQAAEGPEFVGPPGTWESSGIITLDSNALPGKSSFVYDVQAHSIDPSNSDLTPEAQAKAAQIIGGTNYAEGGQIILALPTERPEPVFGTSGADPFDIAIPQSPVDGTTDLVFTGAGADLVDTSIIQYSAQGENRIYSGTGNDQVLAGRSDRVFGEQGNDLIDASQGKGKNRLYGGSGNDEIYANRKDVAMGGEGDDLIDASQGMGDNRLYGGAGNDIFFLGMNDRVVGGDGDDQFYAGSGGGNTITGGAGADQFWIADAQLPSTANTITDLQIGTDVIGIGGLGISFANLSITDGTDGALISINNANVAVFQGVLASQLQASSFVFV
jgi:Bacterial protein of unknown function (DUF839)/RTX calcium-binding nonapeptide repeat (4 copies)